MDNPVQNETARRFVAALRTLEQDRDVEPMAELFAEGATLSRLDGRGPRGGEGGARQFWTEYRRAFGEISTTFTHATEGSAAVALEWTSQGTMPDGRGMDYAGVSVLDIDGGLITGLRTYYDSAAFLTEPARVGGTGEGGEQVEAGHTGADSGFESQEDRAAARGDR
jgi:ketosteroid isomerase-like protein